MTSEGWRDGSAVKALTALRRPVSSSQGCMVAHDKLQPQGILPLLASMTVTYMWYMWYTVTHANTHTHIYIIF